MKIPVLKLNVLTDKSLEEKLASAKAEARHIQNRQMASLLRHNGELTLALTTLRSGRRNLTGSPKGDTPRCKKRK